MARGVFTNDDLLRSKLLPPGWYPILVKQYSLEQAGTDGSDLHVWELRVESGAFKDVPLRFQVSEKAQGMGIEFLEACGHVIQVGAPFDWDRVTLGKRIDAYVQRGEYKGRQNNQVVSFRKRAGGVPETPNPVPGPKVTTA